MRYIGYQTLVVPFGMGRVPSTEIFKSEDARLGVAKIFWAVADHMHWH